MEMASKSSDSPEGNESDTSSPLSVLLEWAEPLYKRSSSDLTLLQLVSVHQSLLEAVRGITGKNCTIPTSLKKESADLPFKPWCTSDDEAELCAAVLRDPTVHLGMYILVLQYLFSKCTSITENDTAAQLWWTLWTFWDEKNSRFQKLLESNDKDEASPPLDPLEMESFLQAVIQVVLSVQRDGLGVPEIQKWIELPASLHYLDKSTWHWHRTMLLLVQWAKGADPTITPDVCQLLARSLERSLQDAWNNTSNQSWKDATGLYQLPKWAGWKAFTQVLLPAFVDLLGDGQFEHELCSVLWRTVWTFKVGTQVSEDDRPLFLLIVTTALCPIWPHLIKRNELPSIASDENEGLPLIKHVDVWDLLKECLKQGLDALVIRLNPVDHKGTPALLALTTLVRRRGLFLLRTLMADREECKEWNQYVACFETLEMEEDKHLVMQVWSTVGDLMASAASRDETTVLTPPLLSTEWLFFLLGHALMSLKLPFLRKENLYRFFQGQTGILVPNTSSAVAITSKSKKKTRINGAPLSALPFDFLLTIILPAFDTLEQSVGLKVHWIVDGKTEVYDVAASFDHFFCVYVDSLLQSSEQQKWLGPLLTSDIFMQFRAKTITKVLQHLAKVLSNSEKKFQIMIENDDLISISNNFRALFDTGRVVPVYRESIYKSFSSILTTTQIVGKPNPKAILTMLNLFPYPRALDDSRNNEESHWIESDPVFVNVGRWLQRFVDGNPSWSSDIPSSLASAFVDGILSDGLGRKDEQIMSRSVVFLCVLAANRRSVSTASQMLWPAINKGLSIVPSIILSPSSQNEGRAERAVMLLEHGCKVEVLSGNGNGDLVIDRKTEQMMPPPPSIEALLSQAVSFLFHTVKALLSSQQNESSGTRVLSAAFAGYLETLGTLNQAFPSSMAVSKSANDHLQLGLEKIAGVEVLPIGSIHYFAMVFAALCCEADTYLEVEGICRSVLLMKLDDTGIPESDSQPVRSVFEYTRWGTLSKLLPRLVESGGAKIFKEVLDLSASSVGSCPPDALMPLFHCSISTGRHLVTCKDKDTKNLSSDAVDSLDRLIRILTKIVRGLDRGKQSMFVLDESSKLIFQSSLLTDEYDRIRKDAGAKTPCRDTFRELVSYAGIKRPHILRTVLSRIIPSWMGSANAESGLLAIPYREDIVDLLMYKPDRMETSATSYVFIKSTEDLKSQIPEKTHELSLVRAFVLYFLSSLPDSTQTGQEVRVKLLNFIIISLLEKVKLGKGKILPMIGTIEYCRSLRGWQALCILSRFVGDDIVETVCKHVFEAMEEQLHSQTRFFLEMFSIQCARKHPRVFGNALCKHMLRHDLHLQMVTSLMIVSGHLVVGHYKDEFLPTSISNDKSQLPVSIDELLAGSIPWLSSTQGFSRAIAQLMVHALIPMVIDVSKPGDGSDWYLRSVYNFLDNNGEMKRLRKKQTKFFEGIDADLYCSLEGCLSMGVDEVGETNPKHLVEVMKSALAEVYKESHGKDAPDWKQVKTLIEDAEQMDFRASDESLVNFQRKIIPLDALNIALDDQREKRFRNMAGRRRQPLIVCASLVDKVPNLGGLARTCEIFAADRMVLPDRKVTKMDNFTSISVSASDWIEIEECNEKDLLPWLRSRKAEGWYVVGIEQTSSSMSMADFEFPNRPTVLLLGKEREGIPVQFLQAVDQCVEIPQLGIIRSLNVHVSGALAIWEFTRQRMTKEK